MIRPMEYQKEALCDFSTRFVGVSGGKRSGKSRMITCLKSIIHSSMHPGKTCVVASPTFGMTRRNLLPIYRQMALELNLDIDGLNTKSPSELKIRWGREVSTIILDCSIENSGRLNGLTLSGAFIDECDKARPEDAKLFVEECIFRVSDPYPGQRAQVHITSAPETNGYMAEFFEDGTKTDRKCYRWSMFDNAMLSDEYKQSILDSIPAKLHAGWIRGEWMYNSDGLVYDCYDPTENHTDLTLTSIGEFEKVHVCWDINDGGTSVVLAVRRGPFMYVLDEWVKMPHTEAVIKKVKQQPWASRAILTCDPACTQIFPYIQQSGLEHRIMRAAPEIEHRVTAVNLRFGTQSMLDGHLRKHLLVNTKRCKVLNKCLMRQGFINGKPDKKTFIEAAGTDISGPLDALGYLVYREFPYNPKTPTRQVALRT